MQLQNWQVDFAEEVFAVDKETPYSSWPLPETNLALNHFSRLSIYRNNNIATLTTVLREAYPLLEKIVGKDFFRVLAKEYIKQYPSTSSDLHEYGAYMADFVREYDLVRDLIYLSEVARFEWVCQILFFAADSVINKLLPKIKLKHATNTFMMVNPACQVMSFHYPILDIIALAENKRQENVDLESGGVYLLVSKRNFEIILTTLTAAEFGFLTALKQQQSLQIALNEASKTNMPFDLEKNLAHWFSHGILLDAYVDKLPRIRLINIFRK